MTELICDFCKQPITPQMIKFRHQVAHANFMVGRLESKDEMCDFCYTRAKEHPPTKEEVDAENKKIIDDVDEIQVKLLE